MPRRRRGLAALAVAAAATAAGATGCQSDTGSAGGACQLAEEVTLPGSPLTLLPSARLDQVRQGYVLLGADDTSVRWAPLDGTTGALGTERSAAVATAVAAAGGARLGLWYGVSGGTTPGDAVLLAVGGPAANGVDEELHVQALPADGSAGAAPGPVVATLPGGAVSSAQLVAMGSSRQGRAAGLAWVDAAAASVDMVLLDGSGAVVATPPVTSPAAAFTCLGFQPGSSDLTLAYYRYDGMTATPTLMLSEVRESGAVESTLALTSPSENPGCPLVAPTDTGYALVWQDAVGTWLGVYDSATNRFFVYSVAGAVEFGGAELQPPVVGFGPVGSDFVLVFAKLGSTELWQVDSRGTRRPGVLAFPSSAGDLGTVSSVPVSGSLFATYADYTATDAGVGAAGQRYFLKASCF
jgi:hypothetical protein